MLFEELELALGLAQVFEQLPHSAQAVGPVRKGHATGLFQGRALVLARQVLQAHEDPHGLDAAGLRGRFRPLPGVRPDRRDLPQQGVGAAFHRRDLLPRDMLGRGAEAARLRLGMHRELLPAVIE
jgi:hypothetical protein